MLNTLCRFSIGISAARASVKKSSSVLKLSRKLLRASQDMQIVDDRAAPQIEEILAFPSIARPSALPVANMGKGMLNCWSFNFSIILVTICLVYNL
jgi:hypothetical protein